MTKHIAYEETLNGFTAFVQLNDLSTPTPRMYDISANISPSNLLRLMKTRCVATSCFCAPRKIMREAA